MATSIRPEISSKKKYWLSKEKYYELKHFCRQYPDWKRAYATFASSTPVTSSGEKVSSSGKYDPTQSVGMLLSELSEKIEMVDRCIQAADPELAKYLRLAVTEGFSYAYLKTALEMPCGRDMFYDRYRKFFWLLARER